jgi:hypothetical protein
LGLLLTVVSALEVGRSAIGASGFAFVVFARTLYAWLPALGAIAISIRGPHPTVTRNGVLVALTVITLMIGVDLSGSLGLGGSEAPALYPDASVMQRASQIASVSWIRTGIDWVRGDLVITGQLSDIYTLDDPRLRGLRKPSRTER